ncbi:MAG TPA: SCO family protein [Candidatus Eremiobacteraceae bacterium]
MRAFGDQSHTPRAHAMRFAQAVIAALALAGGVGTRADAAAQSGANPFAGAPVRPLAAGDRMPDSQFLDQTGAVRTFADFYGKTVVVGFVYTSCKDECPLITRKFGSLETLLPPESFHLIEISIDPAHDTPRVLAAYAHRYGVNAARRTLLTGTLEAVTRAERELGVSAIDDGRGTIVHNSRTVVVNADGRIADFIDEAGWTPDDVAADAKGAAGMAANPLDRMDLALGRTVAYVCGGVVNGRAGLADLIAVLAIFGLSAWAMVWVSRKMFSGTS